VNVVEVCGYNIIWHSIRSEVVVVQLPVQVADFGMSRDLEDENYYISHGGKIPVKWSAPEVGVCEFVWVHLMLHQGFPNMAVLKQYKHQYTEI